MKDKLGYSPKELEMIKELSPNWYNLIINDKDSSVVPPTIYMILAMECFSYNKTGPAVDSLRRCLIALRECKIYRMTPEWDNLIQL